MQGLKGVVQGSKGVVQGLKGVVQGLKARRISCLKYRIFQLLTSQRSETAQRTQTVPPTAVAAVRFVLLCPAKCRDP